MAKYHFDKIVAGEEIMDMVQKTLESNFQIKLKKNRIVIVQDATKGCFIKFKEIQGKTVCDGPHGFMPSVSLGVAIFLVYLFLLFVIGQSLGYLVMGIGVLPMILLALIMKAPSRELVKRVASILEKLVRGDNLDGRVEDQDEDGSGRTIDSSESNIEWRRVILFVWLMLIVVVVLWLLD